MTQVHFPINGVIYPTEFEANKALAKGHWLPMSAGSLVRNKAQTSPKKKFVVSDNSTMTYEQFDRYTEILAASLLNLGLLPGDRAIFQMGTIPETLVALFACYKAGIIPVCTLPQHRELEISSMIGLTNARVHFIQADFSPKFNSVNFARNMSSKIQSVAHIVVARGTSQGVHSLEQLMADVTIDQAKSILSKIPIGNGDVLTFQLSGGSTGVPKIIPRFHGEYLGQAYSIVKRHKFSGNEIAIWSLPLIHNAAMLLIVFPILLSGGTIVLQQRFELPEFLSAIKRHRVSYAGSIGPVAQRLLDCNEVKENSLDSLRMFFALDRADAIESHLKVPTTNLYGITEGLLMTSSPDDPCEMRFKTIGYPTCSADEIKILYPETEKEVDEGELCFRGPYTLRGYYNAPEINATSFTSDGFFRSGDLVRKKNNKRTISYTFLGRMQDNISRGGEKFAAEEVEQLLVLHPAIADAKVVAMPDRYLGEKACAFVILRNRQQCPSIKDLGTFLHEKGLAKYKYPEHIEVLDSFPLTQVGKVDKAAMRHLISTLISNNNLSPKPLITYSEHDHKLRDKT